MSANKILITTSVVGNFAEGPDVSLVGPPSGNAGGDLTGSYPNPTLAASGPGVTTVGSATQIPVVTTDAKGRISTLTTIRPGANATYNQITGVAVPGTLPSSAMVIPSSNGQTFAVGAVGSFLGYFIDIENPNSISGTLITFSGSQTKIWPRIAGTAANDNSMSCAAYGRLRLQYVATNVWLVSNETGWIDAS